MSALKQPASSASSQSPGFTNLSWMEINATVGPPGCSCTLSMLNVCLCVCMPCFFLIYYTLSTYEVVRNPFKMNTALQEVTASPIWPVFVCPLDGDRLSWVQAVSTCWRDVSSKHCCISPFLMEGWKKKKKKRGKKKGASFSPYQLGKAMLCPCNWVGISSINSATPDNKYRVHRQLPRDLKRGCVKEYVWDCLCTFVHVCVLKGKKSRTGAFALMNYLSVFWNEFTLWSYETLTLMWKVPWWSVCTQQATILILLSFNVLVKSFLTFLHGFYHTVTLSHSSGGRNSSLWPIRELACFVTSY